MQSTTAVDLTWAKQIPSKNILWAKETVWSAEKKDLESGRPIF